MKIMNEFLFPVEIWHCSNSYILQRQDSTLKDLQIHRDFYAMQGAVPFFFVCSKPADYTLETKQNSISLRKQPRLSVEIHPAPPAPLTAMLILDTLISKALHRGYYYALYPAILVIGAIIGTLLKDDSFRNSYLASSRNVFNQLFAYKGNHIFFVLFSGLLIVKIIHFFESRRDQYPEEPTKTTLIHITPKVINASILSFVKFTIKVTTLHFLFQLIDFIFLKTGGSCIIDRTVANTLASSSKQREQCLIYNGTWVRMKGGFCLLTPKQFAEVVWSAEVCREYGKWTGGFDVSGHFCFLVTISLVIFKELASFHDEDEDLDLIEKPTHGFRANNWTHITVVNFWKWLCLLTLGIWICILTITSIFYHTFTEKLVGLVMGYVCTVLLHFIIPPLGRWLKN